MTETRINRSVERTAALPLASSSVILFKMEEFKLKPIECVGQDKSAQIFYLHLEEGDAPGWEQPTFLVHRRNPSQTAEDDFFFLRLAMLEKGIYRVETMAHNYQPWYSRKGIPEAVIAEAARLFGAIKSSSNRRKGARQ